MKISPELKKKFLKFKKNRRAYYSMIILLILFLISLPAELLFNNKPIIMKLDGQYFFPVFQAYTFKDLGGESNLHVNDYRTQSFKDFLEGKSQYVNPKLLFGNDNENIDCRKTENIDKDLIIGKKTTAGKKREYWMIWPLVKYNHKANTDKPKCGRTALASPWDTYVEKNEKVYTSKNGKYIESDKEYYIIKKGAVMDGHYLGTDGHGKDVLARIVYGFRVSMLFGLGLAISGTIIGSFLGALQGYFGGLVDLIGQRMTELWSSMPRLFLLIILSSFLARKANLTEMQQFLILFGILNLTAWMGMASHMRAQFLQARNLEYVKAAKSLGVSNFKIMLRHILPNSLTPIVTFFPFSIRGGIMALTSLDFLDLGVKYPAPSLGDLLAQGQLNLDALWILLPTVTVLSLMLVLLTFVGDGVRNAFDPRHKG